MEETKRQRDLGVFLRQRVAQAFREGENTQVRAGRGLPGGSGGLFGVGAARRGLGRAGASSLPASRLWGVGYGLTVSGHKPQGFGADTGFLP